MCIVLCGTITSIHKALNWQELHKGTLNDKFGMFQILQFTSTITKVSENDMIHCDLYNILNNSIESIYAPRLVHHRIHINSYINIRFSCLFFIEITASLNKEHFCFSSFYLTHIYLFMRRCNSDREEGRRRGVFARVCGQ